jgi:hypothetical protein
MKSLLLKVAAVAALFTLIGCGKHDDGPAEYKINWEPVNTGTLEVNNTSKKDVVLFYGQVLTENNILGGVRAESTTKIDVSHFSDFTQGSYFVLKGMTREQYDANQADLAAARVEFNAFATYKAGEMFRVVIDNTSIGDYGILAINRGNVGMELRKNSPEGEKVAFLPATHAGMPVYFSSQTGVTLFPYFVVYNKMNQSITTLKSTDVGDGILVGPEPVRMGSTLPAVYFPDDPTFTWEKLTRSLKSPVAYLKATNNVQNQALYFTNAIGNRLVSQTGYDVINSGKVQTFEIEAGDFNEDTGLGGAEKALIAVLYNGNVNVAVTFEGETGYPILKNGYEYAISIRCSPCGTDPSGYTGRITETGKRDLSKELETL